MNPEVDLVGVPREEYPAGEIIDGDRVRCGPCRPVERSAAGAGGATPDAMAEIRCAGAVPPVCDQRATGARSRCAMFMF